MKTTYTEDGTPVTGNFGKCPIAGCTGILETQATRWCRNHGGTKGEMLMNASGAKSVDEAFHQAMLDEEGQAETDEE